MMSAGKVIGVRESADMIDTDAVKTLFEQLTGVTIDSMKPYDMGTDTAKACLQSGKSTRC